jgi:aromatic ring-opening dioxygenase catalytic subunit (LigB family)
MSIWYVLSTFQTLYAQSNVSNSLKNSYSLTDFLYAVPYNYWGEIKLSQQI